jgi:hypothetical protein
MFTTPNYLVWDIYFLNFCFGITKPIAYYLLVLLIGTRSPLDDLGCSCELLKNVSLLSMQPFYECKSMSIWATYELTGQQTMN